MFSSLSKKTLGKALITKDQPVYVQFYVTARCNLTCEQCNIIYSNADVPECNIDDIERIADNFAEMGVAIVLLTGGEPFARKDLPEIIHAFESRGGAPYGIDHGRPAPKNHPEEGSSFAGGWRGPRSAQLPLTCPQRDA